MTNVSGALRTQSLILDIAADPDLDRDAKLFAVLLVADIAKRRTALTASERLARKGHWTSRIAQMVDASDSGLDGLHFVRAVIRRDVPRYIGERTTTGLCIAPMIRRDGPCGKRAYRTVKIIDPMTGRWAMEGYCTRHWSLDHKIRSQRLFVEWQELGEPVPPANSGGVLRRYFNTVWDELYDWADPYRVRNEGGKEPTIPRPKLELIRGGDE
ncbi:hypothetical protein [Gordonia terrae]|uniref:hypothetical protein n=1 Tax=Gordonia terrae TaxID=2055 RepID=UPI003F6D0AEF